MDGLLDGDWRLGCGFVVGSCKGWGGLAKSERGNLKGDVIRVGGGEWC